jgi:hypothetical protein
MIWNLTPGHSVEDLGLIPMFLSAHDPRGAAAQINEAYAHGGGWRSFEGFRLERDPLALLYPDDPPMRLVASTTLRGETIAVFQYAWVAVIQPDGTFDVARLD